MCHRRPILGSADIGILVVEMSHWQWDYFMQRKRAHILLPEDLLAEMDQFVGERGRSAFLTELVRKEIGRRKLLAALRDARGSWRQEDHPELANGSEAFVEGLRSENEGRLANE